MRVLVTGASGLVGSRLVPLLLEAGHAVVATSRDPGRRLRLPPGAQALAWDGGSPLQAPGRLDAIVHLAGASIAGGRWTAARKRLLVESRTELTRRLAELVARRRPSDRPQAFVCASAVGYYGADPGVPVAEDSPPGDDFLARLCQEWEAEAYRAPTRVVTLRIGHVLARGGGYLGRLLPFSRLGLGGPLGSGRQPVPWIHVDDLCGIVLWALAAPEARGPCNAVAPGRATQRRFVRELDRLMPVPSLLPIPTFALRLRFGEFASAVLGGQDADPARLREAGYRFRHPELREALEDLLRPGRKAATAAAGGA